MDSKGGFGVIEQAALGLGQLPQFRPGSPTMWKKKRGSACIASWSDQPPPLWVEATGSRKAPEWALSLPVFCFWLFSPTNAVPFPRTSLASQEM